MRWIGIRLRPFGPPKLRAVSPNAVQDHSDLAGNSYTRLLRSNALGQPCPPSFERGPTLHLREKDIGGLVQALSSEPISAFRDVALPICFPGLISSRRQEIGPYIAGPSEPAGLIDRRMECQSRHWPDARDRQEASQGELCRNLGDGVNQAADISWLATSIPSRNVTPRTILGN